MRYLIIGLGIYGTNLAKDLTDKGHEVIAADILPSNVEQIKDYVSTAYILDSADEPSLAALPLKNVDVVIVAIGENFGASVRTVAMLKKIGVKCLYARAIDKLHESILEGLRVDRILTPEQRAASDLVNELELGGHVDCLNVDGDTYVLRFRIPEYFYGMKYADVVELKAFDLKLIAVTRQTKCTNVIGVSYEKSEMIEWEKNGQRVEEGDAMVCLGTEAQFRALFRYIN